ncbi:transporter [Erythrobacter sp. NE805]|uniref:transporter n=1 Tax=Erythrobacter sp. NE805 TaxID=3389875 RepID=UPI00396B2E3D
MSQTVSRTAAILLAAAAALAATPALADDAEADASAEPTGNVAITAAAATAAAAQESPAGEWTPLGSQPLGEELFAKWIPVPGGESGAPRQGWLGTADGFFTREVHLAYTYVDVDGADAEQGLARFHLPLSRRLWAGLEVPFYQDRGGSSDFGDVTLNTQVMLAETRNLSLNAGVGWRLPTGSESFGNGVFAAQPQLNLFTDVGGGFSFRGRVAYDFPDSGAPESFILNAAIGQTVTDHDRAPLGDLTWYVASTWREFSNGPTFLSVTPGVRTHLGGNLFMLAGVEIPLTNGSQFFNEAFTVQLVKGF